MTPEQFKIELAKGIQDISEAMSPTVESLDGGTIIKMTNILYNLIVESNLSSDIELYKKTFKRILIGEIPIFKLSAISLMVAFRMQPELQDELGYNESYINGVRMFNKCIPIPPGTPPCPGNLYCWDKKKLTWRWGS